MVINSETYLVTLLRDPWKRIQSDYHYTRSHPNSGHLGPNIDVKRVLSSTSSIFEYIQFPGISNCATKMFNGYHCGDDVELTDFHLETAKRYIPLFSIIFQTNLFLN